MTERMEEFSDNVLEAALIVNRQALHQWNYMFDEVYRFRYIEFLDEMDLSLEVLREEKLMIVPFEGAFDDYTE